MLSDEQIHALAAQEGDVHDESYVFNRDGCWSVLSFARAIERAVLEAQEGWRDIESAPKDGTYILAANAHGAWIAHWSPVAPSGYRFEKPWRSVMLNHWHMPKNAQYGPPTHWMPRPPAPSTKEPKHE